MEASDNVSQLRARIRDREHAGDGGGKVAGGTFAGTAMCLHRRLVVHRGLVEVIGAGHPLAMVKIPRPVNNWIENASL